MKTYTTKANAKRAAKNQNIDLDTVDFIEVEAGQWGWIEQEEEKVIGDYTDCPHCGIHLSNGVMEDGVDRTGDDKPLGNKEFIYYCMGCGGEFGPEISIRHKSVVEAPCNLVWEIADSMPGARRKDVIAAAVEQGVAFYTARTQYQLWKQATNA